MVIEINRLKIAIASKLNKDVFKNELDQVYGLLDEKRHLLSVNDYRNYLDDIVFELYDIEGNDTDDAFDRLLDITVRAVDESDVVVVYEPSTGYDQDGLFGWLIGYCWGQGIPVILISYGETRISALVVRSLHAHLTSEDEVIAYDFDELPVIPFKGTIV